MGVCGDDVARLSSIGGIAGTLATCFREVLRIDNCVDHGPRRLGATVTN